MSRFVHLFQMMKPDSDLVSMDLIGYKDGNTLQSLRKKLETGGVFDSFQFWDGRMSSPVHQKLEGIVLVEEFDEWRFYLEVSRLPSTRSFGREYSGISFDKQ
ncbi:hypothetical protein R1sor_024425 [Riccia sorocarpa]|uniref:Uncharacterized protein n=1 Tax=Riccia sorocarpa TaxID=122646 RepID=A0ABD3GWJ4_9MARC